MNINFSIPTTKLESLKINLDNEVLMKIRAHEIASHLKNLS